MPFITDTVDLGTIKKKLVAGMASHVAKAIGNVCTVHDVRFEVKKKNILPHQKGKGTITIH